MISRLFSPRRRFQSAVSRRLSCRGARIARAAVARVQVIEQLEERTLLSSLNINNGALFYLANSSGLTVSTSGPGGSYTFADNQPIILSAGAVAAGWTENGNTATGPDNSVTSIQLTSSPTDDTFSIQSVDADTMIASDAGNDTINVTANGIASAVTVTVNNLATSGSDSFVVDTGGTQGTLSTGQFGRESYQAAGNGLIDITTAKPGFSDNLTGLANGDLTLDLNSLYTTPTALSTTISVSSGEFEANVAGVFPRFFPIGDLAGVAVGGTTAGESLTLDFTNGNPLPSSGINYDPPAATGGAVNSLTVQGGSFTSEGYENSGPGAGTITYNGGTPITFSNLSPITDTVPSPSFIFSAPAGNQTVNIVNGPVVVGVQTDQINDGGTGSFELVNFANKTMATVNTQGSGSTMVVNIGVAAAGLTTLDVNSSGGNDTVNVEATPSGVATNIDTGNGASNIVNVGSNPGTPASSTLADINSTVSVTDPLGLTTLNILDAGDMTSANAVITGSTVTGLGFGAGGSVSYIGGFLGGIVILVIDGGANGGSGITYNASDATASTTLNGGPGSDTFNVIPSASGSYTVNGNGPTPPASPGDTLDVEPPTGTTGLALTDTLTPSGHQGAYTFAILQPVNYTTIETLITVADLSVTVTVPPQITEGGMLVYSVSVHNSGALDATNAMLTDILPVDSSFSFAGFTQGGPFAALGQTVTGDLGTITAGATVTGSVVAQALEEGFLMNTASVSTDTIEADTANNSQTVFTTVIDAPLTPTSGKSINTTEGKTFTGVVGSFTDADPNGVPGDYSATINWGDGQTSAGTIVPDGPGFDVVGSHVYAEPGKNVPITTSVKDAGGSTATLNSVAQIADAPITAKRTTLSGLEGRTLSGTVATFTDGDASALVSDFTASINWGDGQTITGTIVSSGGGKFYVTGSHAYAEQSAKAGYAIKVSIQDSGGSSASASSIAKIADAPLDTPMGLTITQSAKVSFTNLTLGSFRDQDSLNMNAGDYTGTINWGDGTKTSAQFVFTGSTFNVGSFWSVQGSHKYKSKKTYTVKITLHDNASPGVNLVIKAHIKVV